MLKIDFSCSSSGRSYFEDFISNLAKEDRASILAVFADIRDYGFRANGCDFRQIEGRLWEIKIRTVTGAWRFFYTSANSICILHCYKKQSRKAPIRDIRLAKKRMLGALK